MASSPEACPSPALVCFRFVAWRPYFPGDAREFVLDDEVIGFNRSGLNLCRLFREDLGVSNRPPIGQGKNKEQVKGVTLAHYSARDL